MGVRTRISMFGISVVFSKQYIFEKTKTTVQLNYNTHVWHYSCGNDDKHLFHEIQKQRPKNFGNKEYLCTMCIPSARSGQKKALDVLEWGSYWVPMWQCWEFKVSLLKEQTVLLSTESFLNLSETMSFIGLIYKCRRDGMLVDS